MEQNKRGMFPVKEQGASNWNTLNGKPATFPASPHTHGWDEVNGKPATFPAAPHTHGWDEVTGKPATFPADLSGTVQTTGPQTIYGNKTFWDNVSMIGVDGKIFGFDAAGFQRFGFIKRVGSPAAIGYIGSFDIIRSNAASNMALGDSFASIAQFGTDINLNVATRVWGGLSVWQADGGGQLNFGPTANATWIRLNSSQQHLQFSRPLDMLDRYMLNGRNAIQFNSLAMRYGGDGITPNNFNSHEFYSNQTLVATIQGGGHVFSGNFTVNNGYIMCTGTNGIYHQTSGYTSRIYTGTGGQWWEGEHGYFGVHNSVYHIGNFAKIHESTHIGMRLTKVAASGNQIQFQTQLLDNAYVGISADGRGDAVLQGGGAGTGTDKGLKLNLGNGLTQFYLRGNGKAVHAHDGVLPVESANADFQIKGRLAIGNTVHAASATATTHKVAIEIGGTIYYLNASTTI